MAWEKKGNRRYYTRSFRAGGRIVRQYVGGGAVGELAAAADALRRAERQAQAAATRAEQARLESAAAPLLALAEATHVLTRAALVAAGFRQHDRGEWRRPRHDPNRDHPPPACRAVGP